MDFDTLNLIDEDNFNLEDEDMIQENDNENQIIPHETASSGTAEKGTRSSSILRAKCWKNFIKEEKYPNGTTDVTCKYCEKTYCLNPRQNVVSKRPSLKKHDFEVSVIDGVPTIEVPNSVISDSVPLWEDFLVGRFPSSAPHVAKIHVIVNKIWTLGDKSIKVDVVETNSTSVKFRIRDPSTRMRIMRRGMWNIAGLPMIIFKWSLILEETQPEIKSMPMWVILKNFPHSMYSWEGLGFLSSLVGNPIRLHPETELCSNFEEAKVFVEVNLSHELPKTFLFKLDQDTQMTVEFAYPWLPPRCSRCKKWGHMEETCVLKKVATEEVVTNKVVELEEGELVTEESTVSPSVLITKADGLNETQEDGCSQVSPGKGSRSNEKNKKSLTYGQVGILAASRFSVLSEQEEEEKAEDTLNDTNLIENSKKEEHILETTGQIRASIPRLSKQRVQKDSSTLKAKATLASNSGKMELSQTTLMSGFFWNVCGFNK
ncbi:hypothetical protein ISN45_Aa08g007060 [Arabidopsis thaliana x Arabidopsis arenosa]|uniref:DUF4283 domain-containing protein n=1 Tax=Arabidopsis thaliana x Arabidopsis arenosa TaxID=1240361 RepID=A0A8T1XKE5_9BRAS|nr:hypothetical protein ISN45_Aa08g007060 [Arabidopsis thaliana x Arabidopsis arenosa]